MGAQYLVICLQIQFLNYSSSKTFPKWFWQTKKYSHIPPSLLISIGWSPQRIDYNIFLLDFKALNGIGPDYLSDLLSPNEPPRTPRSNHTKLLHALRTRLCTMGDYAFSSHVPLLWNSLPDNLRVVQTVGAFKAGLKTDLYRPSLPHDMVTYICSIFCWPMFLFYAPCDYSCIMKRALQI